MIPYNWPIRIMIAVWIVAFSYVFAYGATDALDEVNDFRARRGLHPFIRDEGLVQAAMQCADVRAANLCEGHTRNDFGFCQYGSSASATGAGACQPGHFGGWLTCCTEEEYQYAGAGWTMGQDGQRYMSLFVRNGGGQGSGGMPMQSGGNDMTVRHSMQNTRSQAMPQRHTFFRRRR